MLNGGDIHAVAFSLALGYVKHHVRAARFEVAVHHRGGGHAVRVVVAVHGDLLHRVDRPRDALGRAVHVLEQKRV